MKKKIILADTLSGKGRFSYFDFIRGLSILGVVAFHLAICYMPDSSDIVNRLAHPLLRSTRLFIFCSGFGLYYSHLQHPTSYMQFLKHRARKTYLPYIAVVIVIALFPYSYYYNDRIIALLSHIFLFKMFVPRYIGSFGPFWFMSTIFEFYLLFYGFVWIKEHVKNDIVLLAVMSAISFAWCVASYKLWEPMGDIFGTVFWLYGWEFVLGMIAADRLVRNGTLYITWGAFIICFAVCFAVAYMNRKLNMISYINEIPSTCCLLILFTLLWAVFKEVKPVRRLIEWLGSISFEWYLTHMFFIDILLKIIHPKGFPQEVAFCCAATPLSVLVAYLYHRCVQTVDRKIFSRAV